jgi:hypothetical protein
MNENEEIERLMKAAKVTQGTLGPFASVPGLSTEGARTGWCNTDAEALAQLRVNVTRNLRAILKAEKKLGVRA